MTKELNAKRLENVIPFLEGMPPASENPTNLLDLVSVGDCYESQLLDFPCCIIHFYVNDVKFIFTMMVRTNQPVVFFYKNKAKSLKETVDFLFYQLPLDLQTRIREVHYDPEANEPHSFLFEHFVDRIKLLASKQTTLLIQRNIHLSSIQPGKMFSSSMVVTFSLEEYHDLRLTINDFSKPNWAYSNQTSITHLQKEVLDQVEEKLKINYPGISLNAFKKMFSRFLINLFHRSVIDYFSSDKEFQLRSRFTPEMRMDPRYFELLEQDFHEMHVRKY